MLFRSHVGRELMNRLADHLAGVPLRDPGAPAPRTGTDEISRRLREGLEGDEHALREAAKKIVEAIERGGQATEQRAAALVAQAEAGEVPDDAATEAWVRAWRVLQKRFASWAHLRGPAAPEVPEHQLEQAWHELTDLLATRVAQEPFFESMDELL